MVLKIRVKTRAWGESVWKSKKQINWVWGERRGGEGWKVCHLFLKTSAATSKASLLFHTFISLSLCRHFSLFTSIFPLVVFDQGSLLVYFPHWPNIITVYKSAVVPNSFLHNMHLCLRERSSGSDALVACSALKRLYRQILLHGSKAFPSSGPDQDGLPASSPDVCFLFLYGDYDLIQQRMVVRRGHYMKADLLCSQFDVLEPPLDKENVLPLDIRMSITDMAMEVEKHIVSLKSSPSP